MGETNLKMGRLYLDGVVFEGPIKDAVITTETYADDVQKAIVWDNTKSAGFTTLECKIDRILLLKLMGLWSWVHDSCPDRRVAYLMDHGSKRVRLKNYKHAIRLIGKVVKLVE